MSIKDNLKTLEEFVKNEVDLDVASLNNNLSFSKDGFNPREAMKLLLKLNRDKEALRVLQNLKKS